MIAHGAGSLRDHVLALTKGALPVLYIFTLVVMLSVEAIAGPNEDILAAARAGDRAGVEAAFAAGASVNAVDKKGLSPLGLVGLTPLGLAAAFGHRNVAKFLLEHGANVDVVSADGFKQKPLNIAAQYGSADVAALLLDYGANVNARDIVSVTPLQWAALRGHKPVVALLIARGAIVNAQTLVGGDFEAGQTALHLAAAAGHTDIVALLLAHGADVKVRNSDGQTPLQEMLASSLDPATKARITVVLGAKRTSPHPRNRAAATVPSPLPVSPQLPVQNRLPACTDVAGIARGIMKANPSLKDPRVLASAIDQVQSWMGCRPPPQKTECSWVGDTWTCTTK